MFGRKKSKPTIHLQEAPEGVLPLCPHCKAALETLWIIRHGSGFLEQRQYIMCPHCRSFLGYGNINFR